MITILLQHFIFELCIEELFDKLNKNFGWLNWNIKIKSIGDSIKIRISGANREVMLTKCIVESKKDNTLILRSEDYPHHIWITVTDGKITDIKGDENTIMTIFM